MEKTVRAVDAGRLERSCGRRDSIRYGPAAGGIERADVFFASAAFEPHRHDTYAIGITVTGIQEFGYRGERWICLPGQLHFLYPDEVHDGASATDAGFGYRIVHVAPDQIARALDGRPLPFLADPVRNPTPETRRLAGILLDTDEPLDELAQVELLAAVTDSLVTLAGPPPAAGSTIDLPAVEGVREYLAAHATEQTPASTLERISGLDRFTLARHFRRAYGTSPDRYRTLRRLEHARASIEAGVPLVEAALRAGFADQSHLTRHFKRAYGLTPARWARTVSRLDP